MIHHFKCEACDYEFRVGAFTRNTPSIKTCPKCMTNKNIVYQAKTGEWKPDKDQRAEADRVEMLRRQRILADTIPNGTIMGTDVRVDYEPEKVVEPVVASVQKKSLFKPFNSGANNRGRP